MTRSSRRLRNEKHGRTASSGVSEPGQQPLSPSNSYSTSEVCEKHGLPLSKSEIFRKGRRCWKCKDDYKNSPAKRLARGERWEKEFIACRNHLDRRCNKSGYTINGRKFCGGCKARKANGQKMLANIRSVRKRHYNDMMKGAQFGGRKLRGAEIFMRSTGFQIPKGWLDARATD